MSCGGITKKRTWRFDNPEQTTASNVLREIVGYVGNLYMSFDNVLQGSYVLSSVVSPVVVVSPSGITLGSPSVDTNLLTLIIPIVLNNVGTYQFIVTVEDILSNIIIRRGSLVMESLTGA